MEGSGKRDRADDSDAAADAKRPRSSSGRFLAGTVVLFVAPCMGLTQRRVYEDVICKWGGRLHGRLDSTVTHILTTESFPETSAWIAAHVERAPPSVDAQGARLPYPATMHTLEWLHQCVARRTRLAATEFRVRKPESEPRAAVSVATEAPAPPAPPPPSDVGRETPPCECGTLCAMQRAPPGSANAGRPMFVCAKQPSREAGHCRFFEWADEPPRVRAAAYYQRLGLPVPEPPPKRAKTAAASPVRKRKAQPEQQAPQVEEPALEDEAAVDAALLCVVCREPLAEPRTTRCYHTYCGVCVLKLVEAGMACPECRTPLALGELRDPDRVGGWVGGQWRCCASSLTDRCVAVAVAVAGRCAGGVRTRGRGLPVARPARRVVRTHCRVHVPVGREARGLQRAPHRRRSRPHGNQRSTTVRATHTAAFAAPTHVAGRHRLSWRYRRWRRVGRLGGARGTAAYGACVVRRGYDRGDGSHVH